MQVLVIGNIYEMMDTQHQSNSELAKIDAKHLSQKAIYWETEFGPPTIAIVGKELMSLTLDSLPKAIKNSLPREIITVNDCFQPTRSLIENIGEWNRLLKALNTGDRYVHIAAYWYSPFILKLASKLRNEGFIVTTEFPVELEEVGSSLIQNLKDKVNFHRWLTRKGFALLRPYTTVANSLKEVANFLTTMGPDSPWVLKSADSVGGAGVFKLISEEEMDENWLLQRMEPLPGYYSFNEPPFLIEQDVSKGDHVLFPTADFFVALNGTVCENIHTSLQRIAEGRYYTGYESNAGRIPSTDVEKIEQHTRNIARSLAKEGYRGWGNLDYAIRDGEIFLLEFNPRRSALLDGISVQRRLGGGGTYHVLMEDYLPAQETTNFKSEFYIILLDAFQGSQWNWLGAILLLDSDEERENLLSQTNLRTIAEGPPLELTSQKGRSNKPHHSHGSVIIREMEFHDIEEVHALAKGACAPTKDSIQSHLTGCWTKEQYRFALHNKRDVSVSVAESIDGTIIGVFSALKFQSIQRLYPLWGYGDKMLTEVWNIHQQRPFLYWEDHMVVDPAHRRKGIAVQMRKHCLLDSQNSTKQSGMGAVLREPSWNIASEATIRGLGGEFQKFSESSGKKWSIYGIM